MKIKSEIKTQTGIPFFGYLNLSESYISLILGILVVFVVVGFLFAFIKNRKFETITPVKTEIISQELQKAKQSAKEPSYTVVEGDTLWSIAEKNYNSGFVWTEIAKENNIEQPEMLTVGTKISLTHASKILAANTVSDASTVDTVMSSPDQTTNTATITGPSYTVKEGDDLWDIAVRAYGDGYRWVDIAKANNLANPDIIHPDNVFIIPR